jgi:hypothetical protein
MSLRDVPVGSDEILARFVLFSEHIRKSNNTVRHECFMPHPHQELSVTRHKNINEEELWNLGKDVSETRQKTLYGRADIKAEDIIKQELSIIPSEPPKNHANIKSFPSNKAEQKQIAMQIAAKAVFYGCS